MKVLFLFSTLAILLATLTVFPLDTIADSESASDRSTGIWSILWSIGLCLVFVLAVAVAYSAIQSASKAASKENAFFKELRDQLMNGRPRSSPRSPNSLI